MQEKGRTQGGNLSISSYCVIVIQVVISSCRLQSRILTFLFLFVDQQMQLKSVGECQKKKG